MKGTTPVWKDLLRRIQRIVSTRSPKPTIPPAGSLPAQFVDPATALPAQVAVEGTIRFVDRERPYRQITLAGEYRFDDIRREDIVVDIGANVGAFCIRAARLSDHVVAVEPVCWDILRENVGLNRVTVTIITGALGNGHPGEVSWDGFGVTVPTYTLGQIIGMAGGCDFLKCDCEGAEWLIRPEELGGIRRLEMELHVPPIGGPPNPALLEYIGRYYDLEIERRPVHDVMGVLGILHARLRGE